MERNGSTQPPHDWLELLGEHLEDLELRNAPNRRSVQDQVRSEIEALYCSAEGVPPPPVLTFVPDVGWTTVLEFGVPAVGASEARAWPRKRHGRGRTSMGLNVLRSFAS